MHVKSTINAANAAGGLPVAVFCYETQRKFLVKEKQYEDSLESIKQAFGLTPDKEIVFRTSSLDVCRDRLVEIEASAWPHLWSVLDEVIVEVPAAGEHATTTPAHGTASGTGNLRARTSAIASGSGSAASVSRQRRPSASGSGISVNLPSRTPTKQAVFASPSASSKHKLQKTKGKAQDDGIESVEANDHNMDIEGVNGEEDLLPEAEPNPPSDYEEAEEGLFEVPTVENSDITTRAEDDEDDEEFSASNRSVSSVIRFEPPHRQPSTSQSQLATELFPDSPPPSPKRAPAIEPEAPVKEQSPQSSPRVKPPQSSRSKKAEKSPAARLVEAEDDGNKRMAILITGPDEENQSAQFKMRGRHTVNKILKTACASFGLDFTSANLYLVVDVGDDEIDLIFCSKDQTASQCGVYDGAKMVIQFDED